MDPLGEEQLDYGEEEYGGSQKLQYQGSGGAIPALAEEELMGEDEEYDDLYNDVNVGEGFMQALQQQQQQQQQQQPQVHAKPAAPFGNGAVHGQNPLFTTAQVPDIKVEGQSSKPSSSHLEAEQKSTIMPGKGLEDGSSNYPQGVPQANIGNMGFQGGPPAAQFPPKINMDPKFAGAPSLLPPGPGTGSAWSAPPPMPSNPVGIDANRPIMNEDSRQVMGLVENNGPTMLYVGELHWWTTDAELESVMSQYGRVKEIKFFDERASGKSKGYCQVEFYDSAAAAACKDGMNGFLFNGRACVVTFANPQTLKQMGSSYVNKNQTQMQLQPQGRRPMNDGGGRGGMNFQGGDGGRNFGRGGWGRGGQGMVNRGQGGAGMMRGRGVMCGKNMVGAAGGVGNTGSPFGQGLAGPGMGGPAGGLMHPQGMMGAGFDPTFMGRGGPYGGFSAPGFPGMMPAFQAVNTMGLPGVAPHVNPAFFGRGMPANGMGMMASGGMDGSGMWTDSSMGGWAAEEHGRRTRESSYGGDDVGSDYGYGEANHERGGRSNACREKERGSERDCSGNSERRHRDEREQDWDRSERDRYREDKDGYRDNRQRDRDRDNEEDWDRGQSSSRSRSKSRIMQEEDHRSRSRDPDYAKRRRVPSE